MSGSDADGGPDDAAADAAAASACDLTKPFDTPREVPGIHVTGSKDVHGTLTDDELTIFFASNRLAPATSTMHLYYATRSTGQSAFSMPEPVANVGSDQGESNPSVSPDGNTLYFDSPRFSQGAVHIFTSSRANATVAFSDPIMIAGDFLVAPSITADGQVLYAANLMDGKLARLERVGDSFNEPQSVVLPAPSSLTSPVTRDDLTMFLSNGISTMVTRRASTHISFPAPSEINELGPAVPSWISPDGCRLYLHMSTQDGVRIYVAARPQ